jgi:hypothetical protein
MGHYVDDSGVEYDSVRVTFPTMQGAFQEVVVAQVNIPTASANPATVKKLLTVSASNRHIMQATTVESDPNQTGLTSWDTTALMFWREIDETGSQTRLKGIVWKDDRWSPTFNVSGTLATKMIPGDFAKGGAFYNPTTRQHQFFVPWLDNTQTPRSIRYKIFTTSM